GRNPLRRVRRHRVTGSRSPHAARSLPPAQSRDRQRHGRALGGVDVCCILPLGALPAARPRVHAASGRTRLPPREPAHGRVLGEPLREARHALRNKRPLGTGLALAGLGLLLLARAPIDGNYIVDVLPSMLLIGLGAGIAFNPMLLAAMSDVHPQQAGLASGMVNTSFMLGGALGLAVLASVAAARTSNALAAGTPTLVALTDG